KQYIDRLAGGDTEALLQLFTPEAMVDSPVYGRMKATDFYRELSADTQASVLTTKGVFTEPGSRRIALYFNYQWTLKNGEEVNFDVVDIIECNEEHLITSLKIIYDTVQSRTQVAALRS
ncbi:MAG: nuclear transport factor 2 family protein, partial [Lewinella sp.]|nr:nuclear transport factor 2 family protein [Lewinella sp.]